MMTNRAHRPPGDALQASVRDRLDRVLSLVEARPGRRRRLAGDGFTAADVMTVSSLTTMRQFQPVDLAPLANIRAYLRRIGERPAYRRAMARGDPDLVPMLERGRRPRAVVIARTPARTPRASDGPPRH